MSAYTKLQHWAKIGSTEPALCGKQPPGGRAWKAAPRNHPPCPECERLHEERQRLVTSQLWLAS